MITTAIMKRINVRYQYKPLGCKVTGVVMRREYSRGFGVAQAGKYESITRSTGNNQEIKIKKNEN